MVIDVLRASTTASAALAAGAKRVIPFASVDEARRFADRLAEQGETPLLGGERGGVRIEGFHLGNSPLECSADSVADRTILFTTTNGTRALLAATNADWAGMGGFANLSAIADRLANGTGHIHLVCAGTDGHVTLEDVLAAGAITAAVRERLPKVEVGNDEATIALNLHGCHAGYGTRLAAIQSSRGGRNLLALGFGADLACCAETDLFAVVPVLKNGALVLETPESPVVDAAEWSI